MKVNTDNFNLGLLIFNACMMHYFQSEIYGWFMIISLIALLIGVFSFED